jgi:hypothetical protein
VATGLVAFVALAVLPACGAPSNLDHQQQVAFARACTSLIERNVVQATPPVRYLAQDPGKGTKLDLRDPVAFYAALQKYRGPSTFDFHNPGDALNAPKDLLDGPCKLSSTPPK